MRATISPEQNLLLAALPEDARRRIYPHLQPVEMQLGQVLCESYGPFQSAYFPVTSTVSLLYMMENGDAGEVAVVGCEGVVGLSALMGGEGNLCQAQVLSAGAGYMLNGQRLRDEFTRAGGMMELLLHYLQAFITQVAQTAVCNRHHTIEQQLCRWLLLTMDRQDGQELLMTQELIAHMLGVRREGITEAAGRLQQAGLINYRRGHITVLDRGGLEARSCECYTAVKNEYVRLMPHARLPGASLVPAIAGPLGAGMSGTPPAIRSWRRLN